MTASYGAGPRDMRAALDLLQAGRVDPLELVSHRVALPDAGPGAGPGAPRSGAQGGGGAVSAASDRNSRFSTIRLESQMASPSITSHGHAGLTGQRLDLLAPAPAQGHADLLVLDAVAAQGAADLAAGAQPVGGVGAAVEGGHDL